MFFIVSLIALALALAIAIFGLQPHPMLMVFAFPVIAAVYGGLTLIVCNLISSWLGWRQLSLPWWQERPGRAAVTDNPRHTSRTRHKKDLSQLARNLRQFRVAAGLTQTALAKRSGMHRSYLSNWKTAAATPHLPRSNAWQKPLM